jgi:hypothetical protein
MRVGSARGQPASKSLKAAYKMGVLPQKEREKNLNLIFPRRAIGEDSFTASSRGDVAKEQTLGGPKDGGRGHPQNFFPCARLSGNRG